MAPPLRIDTIRNRLKATAALLELAERELHDLHTLAYDRARAAEALRVKGGGHEYALDTNGDPRAREGYRHLGATLLQVCDDLQVQMRYAFSALHGNTREESTPRSRTDTTNDCNRSEVAEAIVAQQRRRARGEHVPVANVAQKLPKLVDQADELRALTGAVRKVARAHRPDRSRLTPLELAAWRRAATR